jgi:putative solute:sodium symporter small subunit
VVQRSQEGRGIDDVTPQSAKSNNRKPNGIWLVLSLWIMFGWLIHGAAATLNGLKVGALPMGFWLAAQGAPLILAIIALVVKLRRERE